VSSITRSFAYAYAKRGIRVNAVLPGIVDTPMQEQFLAATSAARGTTPEQLHEARLASVPLGRTASPRECAETIVWLLSPAAGYLTGQQIAADGGLTMF
jgi:NAD(P)-dependent dehydrogenase (short-subunit alcohol dehydrogenase family)